MRTLMLSILFLSLGCANAQLVKQTVNGGRVVVHGSRGIAAESGKQKAKLMMISKCPSGYGITEEGQTELYDELYYDFVCVNETR